MNSRIRKRFYGILAARDGEVCQRCGAVAQSRPLVIDHRDNSSANNNLSNLQLLCRSCNYLKNPRGRKNHSTMRVRTHDYEDSRPMSKELELRLEREPKYRAWIGEIVAKEGHIEWGRAIHGGSEKVRLSQAALTRYLQAMTSQEGDYEVKEVEGTKLIVLKVKSPDSADGRQWLIEKARSIIQSPGKQEGEKDAGPSQPV